MSATKNPVIRELNGETARERKEKQEQIISRPSAVNIPASDGSGSYTAPQQSELSRLLEQRRQAQVDLDTDTVNRIDQRMKDIRAEAGKQTVVDRVSDAFSGLLNDYGRSLVSAGETIFDRTGQNKRSIQRLQTALDTGRTSDGQQINDSQRDLIVKAIVDLTRKNEDRKNNNSASDRMLATSQQQIESAKQGLGKAGQFAVDLGVTGGQMAVDLGASALIPGAGLALMGARSFGSGAQEARHAGASYGQQLAYGVGSAALSTATEKIASVAGPFKKAFGNGVLDKAVSKAVEKMGGSAVGKTVLSALSEGGEEIVEDLLQPILQRATYDPDAMAHYNDPDYWANTLYDGLIGSALGGIGGGIDAAGRRITRSGQNQAVERTGTRPDAPGSNSSPAAGNAVQVNAEPYVETIAESGRSVQSGLVDVLSDILIGGKRVDQSKLTQEQFDAAIAANEKGTVDMDAAGRVYQVDPAQHIDQRTVDGVADRSVNAFQFDHPSLHSYYQTAARALIADAELSLMFPVNRRYERTMQGNKVRQSAQASEHLRMAMDETGLSRAEIIDAAQRIVDDHGQENVKAAKQVEIILDSMLTNGWSTMAGDTVAPNKAYIDAKNSILGSQPQAEREPLPMMDDGLGAADAGSLNSDYDRLQAQSETFHPEGAYAARPVDVPTTDFDGRNVPKSASTVMGAQGTDAATVQMLEQQIADGKLSFDTIHDTDAVSMAQTTMQEKGFDGALEQYRQAVRSNVATKDNTALGQQLLIQAMRNGDTASTAELLTLYTRNSTTAAQAMQAQSIFRKLSPEGQLLAVQKAVSDLNTKYGTDVQLDDGDVSDFLNAESDEKRQEVTRRIVEKAAQSVPGTFRAKYDTLRYLAMLGNPRTHIRNILGNTFFQVPVAVKNRVGAAVEAVASSASGGKVERSKSVFGVNPFGKLAAECRADWVNAKDFLGQSSKYIEGQASLFNIEQEADAFSNGNLIGRGINKASDINSRALEAEDTAAKKWIYAQSLAGYLQANGCKSISDADMGLLNRARNYAAQEALRNTFNDRNAVSDFVSKGGKLIRSDNPAERFIGYIVEGVMPFKRTPTNIAVRAVEYSPVGAVLGAVETIRGAKYGDMGRVSTGLDRVAAGVSGSALMLAGFLAAGAGYVTGGEDDDEKQRNFDDLTGHQNYAFEAKDGTSVTLDWLAPEAIPFFMGVELYNQGLDGGLSWDDASGIVKNASAPMLEMSMLQGLNDTFENAAYAKNRGDSVLGSVVMSALTNYATQVFPTIGGQMERSSEERRMTTYTDKNGSLPTDLQYTIGKVSQKIPGWDYQQVPYIDAWGRTEESGDALTRSINNLLNPAYVSQVDVDSVEQELQRLKDATGDGGVFPQRAARYFTVNGERKDLTAEEYQKYAKKSGQTRYQVVSSLLNNTGYQRLSDENKAEAISRAYEYADAIGKMDVSDYKPGKSSFAKGAMESVLPPATYILYKINADRDNNGSVTGTESAETLQELTGITDRQRGDAWAKSNSTTKANKNPFTGALPSAGIDTDTSIAVYDKYRTISNTEGMKPKEKAAEFKRYVNSLGLTSKQLQAVRKTYTFFGSYPVDW